MSQNPTPPRSLIRPDGCIAVTIDPKFERVAKQIRAIRDEKYGNIFQETAEDERWVGDLGEIALNSWLKHEGVTGFTWNRDDPIGNPDFLTDLGVSLDVKTVKRKGEPRMNYTAGITARHLEEKVDHFFFLSYELSARRMWFLGGIDRDTFRKFARYYGPGEKPHPDYTIREGHEIYNIELSRLVRPRDWLLRVTGLGQKVAEERPRAEPDPV
jgi:hypothetical protein